MGAIQVAAEDDRLGEVEVTQPGAHGGVPLQAVFQPGESALGVGSINGGHLKIGEFSDEDPAFGIVIRSAQT